MMISLLLGVAMLGQARDAKASELVSLLVSDDRMERHKTALALTKLPSLPESAVENIVAYLKAEVAQAMIPDTRPVRGNAKPLDRIPVGGDELSITRIKANPDQHLESPFVLTGAIGISDYYNFGFRDAQDDYYSFQLEVAARDGQIGDTVHVYMRRFDGAALAERITRTQERQRNAVMAVRLRCINHRDRTGRDLSGTTDAIEVNDWQVLGDEKETWMPWTFESIGLGYALMLKTGKASTVACLDLIMNEQEFQSPRADTMLKGTAIGYLLKLPAKDKTLALRRVTLRAKKAKSAVAKLWARRAYASFEANRLVL